ncbi:MAG: hypothetical protein IJR50_07980 [Treponema sp.]|nr:hypothetical protein [Treponema sp.]
MRQKNSIYAILIVLIIFAPLQRASAAGFFNGYAGIRADMQFADKATGTFGPTLALHSFFAGQFNITTNLIARAEFTLGAGNIFSTKLFTEGADAKFQIDEISLIFRRQFLGGANYLSAFVGTYEPVGSDMFLRRQFGIQPIASKITESWLGLAGSILYPLFGMGISDVVHFSRQPISTGIYVYFNRNNNINCMAFNSDLRFACAYQYFYLDVVAGINVPFKTTDATGAKVLLLVNSLYGHAGMTLLAGNNYTPVAFFLQAGIYDFVLMDTTASKFSISPDKSIYFLAEFRSHFGASQLVFSAFSLPEDTVKKLLFIHDTLGVNVSFSNNAIHAGAMQFELGVHTTLSFPNKYFINVKDIGNFFTSLPTILLAPYMTMRMSSGEARIMLQLDTTAIVNKKFAKAFEINVGYKTQF